jgi:hypothetical protein
MEEIKPKKRTKKKPYFTEETQRAIIDYNNSTDPIVRNRIYEQHIKYPFDKMAENLIHTFKFYHFDIPYEDVKHEVVTHLNEKIHNYQEGKGKAFSYFSIVAKNYLIIANNSNYDKFKNRDELTVIDERRNVINEVNHQSSKEEKSDFIDLFVEYWDKNLANYFSRQKDMMVADAVLELFRTRQNIENYNKKALYILIRERTGVKTQCITKIINILKKKYITMYKTYQLTGNIVLGEKSKYFK